MHSKPIVSALAALIPALAGHAHAQCAGGLTDGLVAYYNFDDGTATDLSGNGNHGTISGPTSAPGISGNGFRFTADGQGINCGNSATLNPSNAITISAWWFPGSWSGSGSDPIVDKGYVCHCGSPYYQYHLSVTGDNYGTFRRSHGVVVGAQPGSGAAHSGTGEEWVAGEWHHLVATWDGAMVRYYANNVLIDQNPLVGTLPNYGRPMMIGTFSNLGFSIRGIVDEVRIYNRGVSAGEVDYLFRNAGGGLGFTRQPEPVAACTGTTHTLTATGTSPAALPQDWMYLDGTNWTPLTEGADVLIGGERFASTSGSTTPELTLSDLRKVSLTNEVLFRSVLTGDCGPEVSDEVSVRICAGDGDCDGDSDSDDIVVFFAAWDAGESRGDIDGDGDADSDDIVIFFAAWDSGC